MILYHAITMYQLECCLVHKIRKFPKEQADILLSVGLPKQQVQLLENEHIFKRVGTIACQGDVYKERNSSAKSILKDIAGYRDYFIAGYHYGLAMKLVNNGISFNVFEEACGTLSRPQRLYDIVYNLSESWCKKAESLGLIDASSPYIKEILCNIRMQNECYMDIRMKNFDIVEEMKQLNKEEIEKIMNIFGAPEKISIPQNSALILTQHFANLLIMDWEEQKKVYLLLVDYFLPDYYLVFKPHPYDLMYYDEIFSNCKVVRERFPSELLPFIFDNKPNCIATVNSTSIRCLDGHFDKKLEFDIAFEKQFERLHRYYVAMMYLRQFCNDNEFSVHLVGANRSIVSNLNIFYQFNVKNIIQHLDYDCVTAIEENSIVIFDDDNYVIPKDSFYKALVVLPKNLVCIFLNSLNYGVFHDLEHSLINDIRPISIKLIDKNGKYTEEVIYIYSKGEKEHMDGIVKELKYSGLKLQAEELQGDKRQIKILEGILEATEKRLLYYIEREKELLKELGREG